MGTVESDTKGRRKSHRRKCLRPMKMGDVMYETRFIYDSLKNCGSETFKHMFSTGWLQIIKTLLVLEIKCCNIIFTVS
jgi:hypothetical protein